MASLSALTPPAPSLTDAQRQALVGYGTALTGTTLDPTQTFGGGLNGQQWVDRFNAAFPGAKASLQRQTGSDGQDLGSIVQYDTSGLPSGWQQALTGPTGGVELSDPDSHWLQQGNYKVINPAAVNQSPDWGTSTSRTNLYDVPAKVDWGTIAPMVIMAIASMGASIPASAATLAASEAGGAAGAMGLSGAALTGGPATSLFGLSPTQLGGAGFQLGNQAINGQLSPTSALSSLMPLAGGALGLPSYASTLGRLALQQATSGQGGH